MHLTYLNPVYPHDFADPFVFRASGSYWAYGTAQPGADGRIFPILRSTDMTRWEPVGGALEPPEGDSASYWAPEVIERDGKFLLFYSASPTGSDDQHRLRVATADEPTGPFRDTGHLLLPNSGFSIDANPFRDPRSGKTYLFFATDFEADEPFGTGLAVVELDTSLTKAVSEPQMVVRACADWQIYERNRPYKGRVWPKWHCVEGPCTLFHDDRYYCLYSGGAWHSENYGVGFAVADHPLGPWRDEFAQQGPTVLRGIPGRVLGPGHNSCVVGPDDKTLFMVYHAWDPARSARRMCIDPVEWTTQGPRVRGPSVTPQPIEVKKS